MRKHILPVVLKAVSGVDQPVGWVGHWRRRTRFPLAGEAKADCLTKAMLPRHSARSHSAVVWGISVITAAISLSPASAFAHVKWFAPYDVTAAPTPITGVFSPHFLLAFLGFMLLVSGSAMLDRIITTRTKTWNLPSGGEFLEEVLIRAGTGAFFMALFTTGGTILTPELRTTASWVDWVQIGIAASMLTRPTCALGAIGILGLYGYGIVQYGAFHLADYPMFLGIAAYLGLTSVASQNLRASRMAILGVSICITLMWGATEKWAYPEWTLPLLTARPYLTMGFAPRDFMILAGFVEFAFAAYIMLGFTLHRLAILGLCLIFLSAIVIFGKLDVIGHLPILVPLAAMFLHGPTQVNTWLHSKSDGIIRYAQRLGGVFASLIVVFLCTYYSFQHVEYGNEPHHQHAIVALGSETHIH